jgi:hypothetical protein
MRLRMFPTYARVKREVYGIVIGWVAKIALACALLSPARMPGSYSVVNLLLRRGSS